MHLRNRGSGKPIQHKHKRPTHRVRECLPYSRWILKIYQIFGSKNKSNNSNFYAPLTVKQGTMSVNNLNKNEHGNMQMMHITPLARLLSRIS